MRRAATVAAAESTDGGVYPPRSVVQLVPTEVMVKHPAGFNAATRDREFFGPDVSAEGSSIRNRGFVDVVNKFGGNCFGCPIKAEPKYDLICERDHGCDPIPVTRDMISAIQARDPRCGEKERRCSPEQFEPMVVRDRYSSMSPHSGGLQSCGMSGKVIFSMYSAADFTTSSGRSIRPPLAGISR